MKFAPPDIQLFNPSSRRMNFVIAFNIIINIKAIYAFTLKNDSKLMV